MARQSEATDVPMVIDDNDDDSGDQPAPQATDAEPHIAAIRLTIDSPPQFLGDWALANSVNLIVCGLFFMEARMAVKNGDIGRFWEVLKVGGHIGTRLNVDTH